MKTYIQKHSGNPISISKKDLKDFVTDIEQNFLPDGSYSMSMSTETVRISEQSFDAFFSHVDLPPKIDNIVVSFSTYIDHELNKRMYFNFSRHGIDISIEGISKQWVDKNFLYIKKKMKSYEVRYAFLYKHIQNLVSGLSSVAFIFLFMFIAWEDYRFAFASFLLLLLMLYVSFSKKLFLYFRFYFEKQYFIDRIRENANIYNVFLAAAAIIINIVLFLF